MAKLLTKGKLVELAGRVSARAYSGNDGQPKAALNFHTAKIRLHGGVIKTGMAANSSGADALGSNAGSIEKDDLPF